MMRPTDKATPGQPLVSRWAASGTGLGFRVIGPNPLSTSVVMSLTGVGDAVATLTSGVLPAAIGFVVAVAVATGGTDVALGATVTVGVGVPEAVAVRVGVGVLDAVGVRVGVSVRVTVGVAVGVDVGAAVGVSVAVGVDVCVGVDVAVGVGVGVGKLISSSTTSSNEPTELEAMPARRASTRAQPAKLGADAVGTTSWP